jgi:hypothetical protein
MQRRSHGRDAGPVDKDRLENVGVRARFEFPRSGLGLHLIATSEMDGFYLSARRELARGFPADASVGSGDQDAGDWSTDSHATAFHKSSSCVVGFWTQQARWALQLRDTAIRGEVCASCVAAVVRAQEQNGLGHLLRPADAAERRHLPEHFPAGIGP